jgi:ABC-type multidrug transport system ATPase subunit
LSTHPDLSSGLVEPLSARREPSRATPSGAAPLLSVDSITKRWKRRAAPVLDGASLTLEPGAVILVQGKNGAGKTTLLRIVAGMIRADSGNVSLKGLHPRRDRREYQRRVGFLSAGNSGLYARIPVRFQLEYWARIAFVPEAARPGAIDRALERFSLRNLASQRSDRLSLGQRQRLRLAMAFLHDPELALLDEPGNSLDDDGKAVLRRAVEESTAAGAGVIWCAPSSEGVGLSFDRAYVIEGGRLIES